MPHNTPKIKAFTTAKYPKGMASKEEKDAGDDLTQQIDKWLQDTGAIILHTDSNSNRYGWMIVITYQLKDDEPIHL